MNWLTFLTYIGQAVIVLVVLFVAVAAASAVRDGLKDKS